MDLPSKGRQLRHAGALVTIRDADWAADGAVELFVIDDHGHPQRILLSPSSGSRRGWCHPTTAVATPNVP